MTNKNKEKNPKAYTIIGIWIILVIIFLLIKGFTTLNFYTINNKNIKEYPVSESKYIKEQKKILENIVTNFNKQTTTKEYQNQNISINATVTGNTIIINYIDNKETKKDFKFILDNKTLSATIPNEDKNIFQIIIKEIIKANQKRLNNNEDIETYLDNILNKKITNSQIKIVEYEKTTEYNIETDKLINNK